MKPLDLFPVVVLISGNGSNLQAIIDAINANSLPITIKAVISNNPNAQGLRRAQQAGIPSIILEKAGFDNHAQYDQALIKQIASFSPNLIILAGFMHVLGKHFLAAFENKIVNIHPSLLPLYPGLNTHQQALDDGVFEHGCSIHFVNEHVDAGPLIAQAVIKVKNDDTVDTLKARVHQAEHFLYPTVLKWFSTARITIEQDIVQLDEVTLPKNGLKFNLTN